MKQKNITANTNIQAKKVIIHPPPEEPPLPVTEIRYSVEKISAMNPTYPYGLEITIQTTVVIHSFHLRLEFDGPIYDPGFGGFPGFKIEGGMSAAFLSPNAATHDNVYEFSCNGFIGREFGPQNPLILRVYGAKPLKLIKQSLNH